MKTKLTKLAFAFFSVSFLFLTSCSNDDANNGTSTGNYLPMAINNKWSYLDQNDQIDEMHIIEKENLNNKTYYKIDTQKESEELGYPVESWFAKSGAKYFTRTAFEMPIYNAEVSPMEVIILQDDLEVNQTWTQNFKLTIKVYGQGSQSLPVTVTGKIIEKGVSVNVQDVNYDEVIQTNVKIDINGTKTETNYWFAKDVGVVKSITTIDGTISTSELINYTLN
ncbi:hypothetical protein [Flavobacterium luminosum]|uniref:Uncharacterized protein n=1 Tax=Flavobacterium luminosum TaxID=2949086 RepID=A0ABT0TMB1_9FLAO|nr:hypothetical protein [Flavobacterium sp. HXWNR70]MCL9808625.1 hypothetical protein [Flavobacterium sp. HXWNR70]